MVDFSVRPDGIFELKSALERAGEAEAAISQYLLPHSEITIFGQGIINAVEGAHIEASGNVRQMLSDLSSVLYESAQTTGFTAAVYESTERAEAERFDARNFTSRHDEVAVYEDAISETDRQVATWDDAAGGLFSDSHDVESLLVTVPDYSGEFGFDFEWTHVFSVPAITRHAFLAATQAAVDHGLLDRQYDLYDFAVKPLFGDWHGMRSYGQALLHSADAIEAIALNIRDHSQRIPAVWTGNASSMCQYYFYTLAGDLRTAPPDLRAASQSYITAAEGAHSTAEAVNRTVMDAQGLIIETAILALGVSVGGQVELLPFLLDNLMEIAAIVRGLWELIESLTSVVTTERSNIGNVEPVSISGPSGDLTMPEFYRDVDD